MAGKSTALSPEVNATYRLAVEIVRTSAKASPSMIAHRLKVSFDLANHMLERMQAEGLVTAQDCHGVRHVSGFT